MSACMCMQVSIYPCVIPYCMCMCSRHADKRMHPCTNAAVRCTRCMHMCTCVESAAVCFETWKLLKSSICIFFNICVFFAMRVCPPAIGLWPCQVYNNHPAIRGQSHCSWQKHAHKQSIIYAAHARLGKWYGLFQETIIFKLIFVLLDVSECT